ncbi:MAG: hypothetical protein HP491_17665 [Nitrospira sp.]|nr:hypothetical protein [Nitrospira sp.]MBH0183456.1 hypothetical protein [Nitrospira sp.]MBH0187098.1 hypothetical protein [Nitrospira sp.]
MKFVSARAIAPVLWGLAALMIAGGSVDSSVWAQSVSGVRGFNGGTAPLVRFPGGSLYIDNQGTQGFLYTPGQNFQTFSFRNPTTGQAWSGAVGTMGPQLSIGLIQGGNQSGNPLVLPGPPRQTAPLLPIQSTIDGFDDIP